MGFRIEVDESNNWVFIVARRLNVRYQVHWLIQNIEIDVALLMIVLFGVNENTRIWEVIAGLEKQVKMIHFEFFE